MLGQIRSAVTGVAFALLASTLAGVLLALAATAALAAQPAAAAVPAPTQGEAAKARPELTKADVDTWLDGLMPYALARADIAGAVVVVVKDGQVLTGRGFGYADAAARTPVDPATTMFRVGSISKLFTWTAVMQLVEQGKLDLDADVNKYIDFKIPPYHGRPVTLRDIMTHTAGFDDVVKGGFRSSGDVPPLGAVVKRMLPKRIYEPGATPAYSNYATALAGYVVERVSGEPYDTYVERHVLQPLGMTHSSFRQPLPANLKPFMSKGYTTITGDAKPFELISVPPAGALSASGDDMAKFMIAHLNQGAGLVRPETARMMHDPVRVTVPGLNRMALGFYEQKINGLTAIGHGGDLQYQHSYLWLLPDQKVGVFFSINSSGARSESFPLRLAFFQAFGDRYFPAPAHTLVELPTAKAHAKMLAGRYFESRGNFNTFLDIGHFLDQTVVGLDKHGRPLVPDAFGGRPRQWIEVAPFVWQDAYGPQRLAAKVENGKVVRWSIDAVSPFEVWLPTPWTRSAGWLMPAFLVGLGVTAITALVWPIGAIVRRRYAAPLSLSGIGLVLHRLVGSFAWLTLATLLG
ncbi:MAG: serine hydrolase domain-containing protein, partial [Phenylobacterium sp.]